jgi:porphobilinogen synthase
MRASALLRDMVRETRLSLESVVMPLFVRPGEGERRAIPSMPGVFQLSEDELVRDARALAGRGVRKVILFGIPETKDAEGSGCWGQDGIVQRATRALKDNVPDLLVIADLCLCEYTDHGHCGVVRGPDAQGRFVVDNDATLELLARAAVSQARAGADVVAPSDMMDGRVGAIRAALDAEGFGGVPILAYSAKYASSFYGPFRDAAQSAPRFGDRRGYQMDPANSDEALREIELDIEEGADMVMVKPALPFLDIIRRAKETFEFPLAAYAVSGEYAMVKAAAERGWLDERAAALEALTAIRRAGADLILTYWAKDLPEWLAC